MKPVTQRDKFGCGIACAAFIIKKDYSEVLPVFGKEKAKSGGFYCKDLTRVLTKFGLVYSYKYLKSKLKRKIYKNGIIIFVKRSKKYPAGHYLTRYESLWMDPWINFQNNKNIKEAKSGFRKRLPGTPIYVLFSGNRF